MAAIYGIIINSDKDINVIDAKYTDGDGLLGGIYMWDASSSEADDKHNVINPTGHSGNGRHIRLPRDNFYYPQGTLTMSGTIGTLVIATTVGSNGEVTVNLTKENTAGGTAIFSEVTSAALSAVRNSANAIDLANGGIKTPTTLTGSPKTITLKFANGLTMLILGASSANTASGVAVLIAITGRVILP